MSMVKIIEVSAQSDEGFDQAAVAVAAKTVRGIKEIYIKDMNALVETGKITLYRVTAKISFYSQNNLQNGLTRILAAISVCLVAATKVISPLVSTGLDFRIGINVPKRDFKRHKGIACQRLSIGEIYKFGIAASHLNLPPVQE